MSKRELIECLEALECSDDTEVRADDDGIGSTGLGSVEFDGVTIYLSRE